MRGRWSRLWLLAGLASFAACGSELKPEARLVAAVQVSKSEPGPWCRPLGAIEGGSEAGTSGYVSAYHALRSEAALRGGNYVVIDHVSGAHTSAEAWRDTIIAGRVFECPIVAGFPKVHVYVSDPPEQVSDNDATAVHPATASCAEQLR
jgi:hypothetical protein